VFQVLHGSSVMSSLSLSGDFGHRLLINGGTVQTSGDGMNFLLRDGHESLWAKDRMLWF
jgi:hypothetical protein